MPRKTLADAGAYATTRPKKRTRGNSIANTKCPQYAAAVFAVGAGVGAGSAVLDMLGNEHGNEERTPLPEAQARVDGDTKADAGAAEPDARVYV